MKIDYEVTSKYYKIASFYGDVQSMLHLGRILNNGKLNFDIDQSIKYLKSASNHDNDQVNYECARALLIKVINDDKKEVMKKSIIYFKKSIERGNSNACFSYSNILFLNAFYQFLDNSNTINESYKYLDYNNKFYQSYYNLFKSNLFTMNEFTIQEKDIDSFIFKYGTLILKNTIKNHEQLIDCIFFYKTLKRFHSNSQKNHITNNRTRFIQYINK